MPTRERPLRTYEDRKQYFQELGKRVESGEITFKEWTNLIYHWMMFEYTLHRKTVYTRRAAKHRKALNEHFAVLNFRFYMNDHE